MLKAQASIYGYYWGILNRDNEQKFRKALKERNEW